MYRRLNGYLTVHVLYIRNLGYQDMFRVSVLPIGHKRSVVSWDWTNVVRQPSPGLMVSPGLIWTNWQSLPVRFGLSWQMET